MKRLFDFTQAKQLCASHQELIDMVPQLIASRGKDADKVRADAAEVSKSGVIKSVITSALQHGNSNTQLQPNERSLIYSAYIYDEGEQMKAVLSSQEPVRREINRDIDATTQVRSRFRWFFSGKKKKEAANLAYQRLTDHLQGEYAATVHAQIERNNRLGTISPVKASGAVSGHESDYFYCIQQCTPELAEKNTISGEIAVHIQKVNVVTDQYQFAKRELQNREGKAKAAAERAIAPLIMAQTVAELEKKDIEMLSRKRNGIRIKALRDAGYQTMADLLAASVYNLGSVPGISGDMAKAIKADVNEIAQEFSRTIKIRIDSGERTPENTELLKAVYRYDEVRKISAIIPSETKKSLEKTEDDIDFLSGLKNNLTWVFSTPLQKKQYVEAFQDIEDGLAPGTMRAVQRFAQAVQEGHPISDEQVWEDFIKRSVEYYTILEELFPEIFGHKDEFFGLPEELAREIQEEVFFPEGLLVDLRAYQVWGVKYILHQGRVLLGDEMGLGKTVQAIATMVSLRNTGARKFLVVCPASVLPNWCREIDIRSKFHSTKIHGNGRKKAFEAWERNGGVAVTTYETLGTLTMSPGFKYDLLVVDEAHFIKNENARRTQNVRLFGTRTDRILYMTGTALENKVDEMISLLEVLNPDIAEQVKPLSYLSTAPQFRRMVAPVYYRRKREDVLREIPDVEKQDLVCELSSEDYDAYEQAALKHDQHSMRKVSWTTQDLNKSAKACLLKDIVEKAEEDGRKVLVFSFYLETMDRVMELLGRRCCQPINGKTTAEKRQQIIDDFEKMPAGSVLPAQIVAGGTGLNIQAASVVVLCEPQLKPSIEDQAIARSNRMGQTEKVLVYRLLALNTIDERINDLLNEKRTIFNEFADKSVAYAETEKGKTQEIDDKTFNSLIKEEIDRIISKKKEL